jgi:ferrochelatase
MTLAPSSRIGVLPVNVGTPDAPHPREVRRYLREFLGDPRVFDVPPALRWFLLNFVILPFRPRRSAEAYEKVWTSEGSPLLVYGRRFEAALQTALGDDFRVILAMRYQSPSMRSAFETFRAEGIDRIVVFPLFPQYASATTGTVLENAYRLAASYWNTPHLRVVDPYYDHEGLIEAFREVGEPILREIRPDHVLFSFHGLPERQVRKSDESGRHCLASAECCAQIGMENRNCYRAQCRVTASLLAARLELPPGGWTMTFQSRLGRDPWIRPYTDETVVSLAKSGFRRIAAFSPAFVADCLETIEEIGMQARASFLEHGGEEFRLVPSLNAHPRWIAAAASLVRRAL